MGLVAAAWVGTAKEKEVRSRIGTWFSTIVDLLASLMFLVGGRPKKVYLVKGLLENP